MSNYPPLAVHLDAFEGPLDLLLHLIEIHELDISKLAIRQITDPYLAYVRQMQELNFDSASTFLVVAATLILWKSRSLLPPLPTVETSEVGESSMGPEELLRRLELHRLYSLAGSLLGNRPRLHEQVFKRQNPKTLRQKVWRNLDITELAVAFQSLLVRARKRNHILRKETVSISDRIQEIGHHLKLGELTEMIHLLSPQTNWAEQIATLLALLELARLRKVQLFQETPYGPVFLELIAALDAENLARSEFDLAVGGATL